MGWERGRYYTRSRKVNGRVEREYVGGGEVGRLVAHMDAIKRAERKAKADAWRAEKARLDALDAAVAAVCRVVDLLARAVLTAAGYHQHHRGEWRKRRKRIRDTHPTMRGAMGGLQHGDNAVNEFVIPGETKEEQRDWLRKLFERALAGDEKIVPELRKILAMTPDMADAHGGNLAEGAERSLVKAIAGKNLTFREAILCKLKTLRAELAGPKPTPLERLLVERVIACWLHVQDADCLYAQAKNITFAQGDYIQRRQDRVHRRYLSAIKTLAVIRRLALPIQVDLNVATTVETTQNESAAVPSRLTQLSAN